MSLAARLAALTLAAAALPCAASAAMFHLQYTTFADGVNAPVTVDADLTTDDGEFYGPGAYLVTAITGTRGAEAITGLLDPFSELYFPATQPDSTYGFSTYVDSFGITFGAGGNDYQLYRDPGDTTFYHEYSQSALQGLLIQPSAITVTDAAAAVPEPASWAMLLAGFALGGGMLRAKRRGGRTAPAPA